MGTSNDTHRHTDKLILWDFHVVKLITIDCGTNTREKAQKGKMVTMLEM